MNYFFQHWVDLTAMVLSLAIAIVMAVKQARSYTVKAIAAFFFLFGPLVISVHVFFHLLNVTYNVAVRIRAHTFVYDFRLYSLYLMGIVVGYLSIRLLRQSVYKCAALQSSSSPIYKTMIATAVVSVPTVVFTPIGSLPAIGCLVSLLAMAFLKRKASAREIPVIPAAEVNVAV